MLNLHLQKKSRPGPLGATGSGSTVTESSVSTRPTCTLFSQWLSVSPSPTSTRCGHRLIQPSSVPSTGGRTFCSSTASSTISACLGLGTSERSSSTIFSLQYSCSLSEKLLKLDSWVDLCRTPKSTCFFRSSALLWFCSQLVWTSSQSSATTSLQLSFCGNSRRCSIRTSSNTILSSTSNLNTESVHTLSESYSVINSPDIRGSQWSLNQRTDTSVSTYFLKRRCLLAFELSGVGAAATIPLVALIAPICTTTQESAKSIP